MTGQENLRARDDKFVEPIWVAGAGLRLLALARYASGWNGISRLGSDDMTFRSSVAELRLACERRERNSAEIDVSCLTSVLVGPELRKLC